MFNSVTRRTAKTVSVTLAGIAIAVGTAGASGAATGNSASPKGIVEKWVFIRDYNGTPGGALFACMQAGQGYIDEGLASNYQCNWEGAGYALYILTCACAGLHSSTAIGEPARNANPRTGALG